MLVSEVIERTYNTWLYPYGVNRPMFDKLTAGLTSSALTPISITGRIEKVPRDSVIEIGSELILLESVSGTTLTAAPGGRGWLETAAVTHSTDDLVWLNPQYSRRAIFNALVATITTLVPAGVYSRLFDTETVDWAVPIHTLPSGGLRVVSVTEALTSPVDYDVFRPGEDYEELLQFSPPKYRIMRGSQGATLHVVYAAEFTLPTVEADELNTLAAPIPASLQPHLPMAVAGLLLQGKEPPRAVVEQIQRRLALEGAGAQVGSALNVGQRMLDLFLGRYVAAERDRLAGMDQSGFEIQRG